MVSVSGSRPWASAITTQCVLALPSEAVTEPRCLRNVGLVVFRSLFTATCLKCRNSVIKGVFKDI
jgi:hypothetical protein